MSTSSWTVVEFVETKTVEAVPTGWLHNSQCYWPPMARSKIMTEIKNCPSPNTCWPLYSIRIFKDGTHEDYFTARKKAKKAEDTSDLNSEYEMDIKKKIFQSSSESETESEALLPHPPKLKLDISSKPLSLDTYISASKFQETDQENPVAKQISGREEQAQNLNCDGCKMLHKKLDVFMIDISKQMCGLKANLYQIREDLQILINRKQEQLNKENNKYNFFQSFEFPIKNYDDLARVNEYLEDEDHFKQAEHQMTKLGGKDVYDFIRRCFQQTMSDSLAMHYTLDGTKNKQPFKNLKLGALIIAASDHYGSDHKTSEEAIRKWLRRATERNKYKK